MGAGRVTGSDGALGLSGALIQATRSTTGGTAEYSQGDPVLVYLPPEALRVLAGDPGDTAPTVTAESPTPDAEVAG